jgi:uncharacterized membrane protein YadS
VSASGVRDVLWLLIALLGALVSARYFLAALLDRDRILAVLAAAGVAVFCAAAALYIWWFF